MTVIEETNESSANRLCKACGLCCTGHLFIWTKLRSAELDSLESLGLRVIRSFPSQRGFNQPCPLWKGQCTIYASPSYPRSCQTYKCDLLRRVLDETTPLDEALRLVEQTKEMIRDVQALLPHSPNPNFRERLAAQLEALQESKDITIQAQEEFRKKASELLSRYEKVFGVKDVVETWPDA